MLFHGALVNSKMELCSFIKGGYIVCTVASDNIEGGYIVCTVANDNTLLDI